MGLEWDRIDRASLHTQRTTNALVVDRIVDQRSAFTGRTNTIQMGFVLFAKILKGA